MKFTLPIQNSQGVESNIEVSVGETLFVVGPNGTGKSSIIQRFATQAGANSKKISAHRQTWLSSSSLEFVPSQKPQLEQQQLHWNNSFESRYKEQNSSIKTSLTLYDLIESENLDSRRIANAHRAGNIKEAEVLAANHSPLTRINQLLSQSNIPIFISIEEGDSLMASKNGGPLYGIAELSDGERNALLIAADVLTAKQNSLLLIDEPERHLHRSIISPLLSALIQSRKDCAFIVATHDLLLPVDNPDSNVLIIRSCNYVNRQPSNWDYDFLKNEYDLSDDLKSEIVGSRRKILFVEGTRSSLDQQIYSLLFPNISVFFKGSSRDVIHAVDGIRSSSSIHWVNALGLIDRDGRDDASVFNLKDKGVFSLPFYSVESIYYHPLVINSVADRFSSMTGGNGVENASTAIAKAIEEVKKHIPRLAARSVEKSLRKNIFDQLPTFKEVLNRDTLQINIDIRSAVEGEANLLNIAAEANDWFQIVSRRPIRETSAPNIIADVIGAQNRNQYHKAVIQALRSDSILLDEIRSFFKELYAKLDC